MEVHKKDKKHNLCVISMEIKFLRDFALTQRAITQRSVLTLGPIFTKMVLNWAQGLKEKSQEVSVRKNINQRRYNKKCRGGGADSAPPALLGLLENKRIYIYRGITSLEYLVRIYIFFTIIMVPLYIIVCDINFGTSSFRRSLEVFFFIVH